MLSRFHPPDVAWTPELRWILFRGFGPRDAGFHEGIDPARAFDLAQCFDLSARICSRTSRALLERATGASLDGLTQAHFATVASSLKMTDLGRRLGKTAGELGTSIVFLKGAAIDFLHLSGNGGRRYCDLDILVPLDRIGDFSAALHQLGWKTSPLPDSEHQEVPLFHPVDGTVEIHRTLLGVRLPGSRRSLDATALDEGGMTRPIPGFPASCVAPVAAILRAHAIVHGLAQHGSAPASYPMFRLLADLADLGSAPADLAEAGGFLREIDGNDLAALGELIEFLRSGGPAYPRPAAGPVRDLLFHILAGALDDRYRSGLKADPAGLSPLSDRTGLVALLLAARKAAVISNAQVDAIYGPPKHPIGYAARRLLRPFDLIARFAVSLGARLRSHGAKAGEGPGPPPPRTR